MRTTRVCCWFFICLGLLTSGSTVLDWTKGETRVRYGRVIHRDRQPEAFRSALSMKAIQSVFCLVLGLVPLAILRRFERLEPMSPRFRGGKALDELSAHLDREHRLRNLPVPKVGRPPE